MHAPDLQLRKPSIWARLGRHKLWAGAGVVLILSVGTLLVERYRGWFGLRDWRARLEAKGERFSIAALAPATPKGGSTRVLTVTGADALFGGFCRAGMPSRRGPEQAVILWRQPAWQDEGGNTNSWEALRVRFDGYEQSVAQMQALVEGGVHIQLAYEQGFGLLLPHLARVKMAATSLSSFILLGLREGHWEEAGANLCLLLRFEEVLRQEHLVIGQLVRLAVFTVGLDALWQALQSPAWTDEQLARFQAGCEGPRFLEELADSLRMERAMLDVYFGRFRRDFRELQQVLANPGFPGGGPFRTGAPAADDWLQYLGVLAVQAREAFLLNLWRVAWVYQDQLHCDQGAQRTIEGLEALARGQTSLAVFKKATVPLSVSAYDRARYLVSLQMQVLVTNPDSLMSRPVTVETRRELARAAIALKRYALRHGRLPETLEALVPEFLRSMPHDYFDGRPLRYRPQAEGTYRLYSVGENGTDEGGAAARDSSKSPPPWTGPDLVWPWPTAGER